MTLSELDAAMAVGVSRPDVANAGGSYVRILNDSQREICRRRSWSWMKRLDELTVPAGQTYLQLPLAFKEFTSTRSPVHLLTSGVEYPVAVWTLEKHKRRAAGFSGTEVVAHLADTPPAGADEGLEGGSPSAFVEQQKRLEFLVPFESDATFTVLYYAYLADLSTEVISNALTTYLPEMLLSLAKARAFFLVNDPVGADHLAAYEQQFRQAAAADGYSQIAGTNLRM